MFRTLPAEETFRLIDFYPPDSWRENDRAFVLHNRLSNLGRHRFGLLFQDQSGSGACFAVLGGCHGRNMNSWVSLLQDPDDFTAIIREHEDTLTTKAMITWKNGESRVEIVAELEVMHVGYDNMIVVDVKISYEVIKVTAA